MSSQNGIINLFRWDFFGDCNDRISGHPSSIDAMIKYDDFLITACEDGLIRTVSVHPNRITSIIGGDIDTEDLVPISALSVSYDQRFLAAANHDYIV